MIDLKILHTKNLWPRGFWLQVLWIFSIGIQFEHDSHGRFMMCSFGIYRMTSHFTLTFDTKDA